MYQFYIIEIQKYATGEFGHLVHWASDADANRARMKAEAKYHEVLAAAAISDLPQHAAVLLAADGTCIMHQVYVHAPAESAHAAEMEAGE